MSWLGGYKPSTSKASESDKREEKRNKLEKERQERLLRAQQREAQRLQFQKAAEARKEADEALQSLLDLDPHIFEGEDIEIPQEEISELLDIKMANFDELNADNGADAIKNLGQIKVNWDKEDPTYFFQKLETELQIFEVNKQYTKRQALIRLLPDDVGKEFKHLINLQETAAGNTPYKTLKDALIKSYGPRPGAAFQKAMNRVMTGKPSVLLKLLVSDICKQNLVNCCCNSTVWGIFQLKIPMYLKNGLANENFIADNMHNIMDRADNLWDANQVTEINSVAVSTPVSAESNQAEISAVRGRGTFRGRGRGRGSGRGRGGQNRPQGPDPRGKRHESNPPWNSCGAHWVYASDAFKCQSPTTCPMKDKVKPKSA